jgi:hypothetical protein
VTFGLTLLLAASIIAAVMALLRPPPAPPVASLPFPAERPLANHLLLVVVDGLRHDIATDPDRMPSFAAAMRRRRSAEIWAGRITMTSSAVLAYGTGQQGALEEVVRDMFPRQPSYESWLSTAARRGLSLASVGDPAWVEMYRPALAFSHVDPVHLAVEVDFNDETFAATRDARARRPNFLVSHFVTPDHQGHAWGIFSERYRRHIRDYDARLAALLAEFGPEWTVIVTSDHGAVDTGTHGTDIDVERRVPLYAYGPGIAPKSEPATSPSRPIDQVDLAGTMAVLLGVPPPVHGRGKVLVDWLDLSAEARAAIAAADARRASRYEEALARTASSLGGRWLSLGVLLLALVAVRLVAPGVRTRVIVLTLIVVGGSVAAVYGIERLPGGWPTVVRVALAVVFNAGLVAALVAPSRSLAWLHARGDFAPILVPGLVLVTYPPATRLEIYPLLFIGVLVLAATRDRVEQIRLPAFARPALRRPAVANGRGGRPDPTLVRVLVLAALLLAFGLYDGYYEWTFRHPSATRALAALTILLWIGARVRHVARHRNDGGSTLVASLAMVAIAAAVVGRPFVSPFIGRSLVCACGLLALHAALSRRPRPALDFALASYLWIGRDMEVPGLLLVLAIADLIGELVRRRENDAGRPAAILVQITLAFVLLFAQRLVLQGSIDFARLDWRAGGFSDPQTPVWVITATLIWKHTIGACLALGAFLVRVGGAARDRLLQGLVLATTARAIALFAMLAASVTSFWTGLRVLSDLPHALIALVVTGAMWACCYASSPASHAFWSVQKTARQTINAGGQKDETATAV